MGRLIAICAVLALAGTAAGATLRERTMVGSVTAVGIAGTEVAYSVEYRHGCHEIRAWEVTSFADRRVARHCFASTSTGSGVAGVMTTGGRSLWLTYTGGNIREWSLWTKGERGRVKRIAFAAADVDGPAPVVLGRVWEDSLPYAIGRTVVVLAPNGSRKLAVSAPDRVVALSAHSQGYAAVLANGHVITISPDGRLLRDFPFEPGAVQEALFPAAGLMIKTRDGLEIRKGDALRTIPLPRGARFLGYSEQSVAYGVGSQLRVRHISSGNDKLHRTLAPGFRAQLGRRGIVYASGKTLGFTVGALLP